MFIKKSKFTWMAIIVLLLTNYSCAIQEDNIGGTIPIEFSATVETPVITSINPNYEFKPQRNGIYLQTEIGLVPLNGIRDDIILQLEFLPFTTNMSPSFSIMGENYQIGSLKILPYYAGIGVNIVYSDAGALIENIFNDSPAQAAGLQIGDLLLSVDGNPIERPLFHVYTQGMDDLIGIMYDRITLEVLSGTISKTIVLPRTYTNSVNDISIIINSSQIKYQIEPQGDYIILRILTELTAGVYRFEFPGRIPTRTPPGKGFTGGIGVPKVTNTPIEPTLAPTSIIPPIWVFMIRK